MQTIFPNAPQLLGQGSPWKPPRAPVLSPGPWPPRLAADARYVVTDLNHAMLDHAANMQGMDDRIAWRQADALQMPFEDDPFDAVVCHFAVMFFPDKVAGYAEALRVLKPGGSFIFNVWDAIEANEFSQVATEAAESVFPDDPPQFLARTPHGYHDVDLIRNELAKAGFSQVSITTLGKTSTAASVHAAA